MTATDVRPIRKPETSTHNPKDELAKRRSEKARAGHGESLREYAERLAAEAPPLSPERIARLAVLLGVGSASNQRKANRMTDSNHANAAGVAA
jgi:hypothetical protein